MKNFSKLAKYFVAFAFIFSLAGAMGVNAYAAATATGAIDYIDETVEFSSVQADGVEFSLDAKIAATTKWNPVFKNANGKYVLDISKIVPTTGTKTISFRDSVTDYERASGSAFVAASVSSLEIKARPAKPVATDVVPSLAALGMGLKLDFETNKLQYQVVTANIASGWATSSALDLTQVKSAVSFNVRDAAVSGTSFASLPLVYAIPAAAPAPNVKYDPITNSITGATDKMEFTTSGAQVWIPVGDAHKVTVGTKSSYVLKKADFGVTNTASFSALIRVRATTTPKPSLSSLMTNVKVQDDRTQDASSSPAALTLDIIKERLYIPVASYTGNYDKLNQKLEYRVSSETGVFGDIWKEMPLTVVKDGTVTTGYAFALTPLIPNYSATTTSKSMEVRFKAFAGNATISPTPYSTSVSFVLINRPITPEKGADATSGSAVFLDIQSERIVTTTGSFEFLLPGAGNTWTDLTTGPAKGIDLTTQSAWKVKPLSANLDTADLKIKFHTKAQQNASATGISTPKSLDFEYAIPKRPAMPKATDVKFVGDKPDGVFSDTTGGSVILVPTEYSNYEWRIYTPNPSSDLATAPVKQGYDAGYASFASTTSLQVTPGAFGATVKEKYQVRLLATNGALAGVPIIVEVPNRPTKSTFKYDLAYDQVNAVSTKAEFRRIDSTLSTGAWLDVADSAFSSPAAQTTILRRDTALLTATAIDIRYKRTDKLAASEIQRIMLGTVPASGPSLAFNPEKEMLVSTGSGAELVQYSGSTLEYRTKTATTNFTISWTSIPTTITKDGGHLLTTVIPAANSANGDVVMEIRRKAIAATSSTQGVAASTAQSLTIAKRRVTPVIGTGFEFNYNDETLYATGTAAETIQYRLKATDDWSELTSTSKTSSDVALTTIINNATAPLSLQVRTKYGEGALTTSASLATTGISLPLRAKEPSATYDHANNKITGITDKMEFATDSSMNYIAVTTGATAIENAASETEALTYSIRIKAVNTGTSKVICSNVKTITLAQRGTAPTLTYDLDKDELPGVTSLMEYRPSTDPVWKPVGNITALTRTALKDSAITLLVRTKGTSASAPASKETSVSIPLKTNPLIQGSHYTVDTASTSAAIKLVDAANASKIQFRLSTETTWKTFGDADALVAGQLARTEIASVTAGVTVQMRWAIDGTKPASAYVLITLPVYTAAPEYDPTMLRDVPVTPVVPEATTEEIPVVEAATTTEETTTTTAPEVEAVTTEETSTEPQVVTPEVTETEPQA